MMINRILKCSFIVVTIVVSANAVAQNAPGVLTVQKIMRDPRWMGSSPSDVGWSSNGKTLYFSWNPDNAPADSIYKITPDIKTPQKVSVEEQKQIVLNDQVVFNKTRTASTWVKNGDIYYRNTVGKIIRITQTRESEDHPVFSFNETKIVYNSSQNLYAWDIATGTTLQLTRFTNDAPPDDKKPDREQAWLKNEQLTNMQVLKARKENRDATEQYNRLLEEKEPQNIYLKDARLTSTTISPDGRFITYRLYRPANGKRTIVPDYVTESGYATDINGRTKVGSPQGTSVFCIYDRIKDTSYEIKTGNIPGIRDIPAYIKDYPGALQKLQKDSAQRSVSFYGVEWSPDSRHALLDVYADDHKDRWLLLLDTATRNIRLIDRQHDDAWTGGPDIGPRYTGWIDDQLIWFQSEATGYSHLYTYSLAANTKTALTTGNYEVQEALLSNDKKSFYIITNEIHPGEKQFYKLGIKARSLQRITQLEGANEISISPDEKYIAIRNSYINKPWELYLQENKAGAKPQQLTFKAQSDEFKQYRWRVPDVITFTARDGAKVYARIYKPEQVKPGMPAVFFVHGAGYLQNAHKWWSSYFREYMFNNLLADNGYYVMDIDYRGSAGYGRDWRTGIYRHMGGRDLTDHVDAVKYLTDTYQVDPAKVGMYGGSYGGFMTLMALFTEPDVFKSGAALRPVTDWANYNHGYTSNILNEPFTDSLAYARSSPLYFAKGLKGNLLICHGMVDTNVNFQDAVKLAQRLIELGKDNWELAPFPMEDHGFVEPSSWTDEYKRIFKLFENTLKRQ